jgi:hypothetical protein
MQIIVPLAGPDFELTDGTTRAERLVEGLPLLRLALETRSWWRSGAATAGDLVFILRDTSVSRHFAQALLQAWYPGSRTVFLGSLTGGAALTSLCGLALADDGSPICIDLADIVFNEEVDPVAHFQDERMGGMLLTFESSNPAYSYAEIDAAGHVLRTAEKQVISNQASAGVYFFRDASILLRAIAHSIRHRASLSFNDLLYVCPLYNGVIADGATVATVPVRQVRDIKIMA